jgi:hypothetical protein
LEIAARSTGNAIKRHAESIRDEHSRLACRAVLVTSLATGRGVTSPAELLGVFEQVAHVVEATQRDDSQLPVALRAATAFAIETPKRSRDVAEMLRLVLRHGYTLSADYVPRQLRDDGAFRASSLADVLSGHVPEYLDDATFQELAGSMT